MQLTLIVVFNKTDMNLKFKSDETIIDDDGDEATVDGDNGKIGDNGIKISLNYELCSPSFEILYNPPFKVKSL